MSGYYYNTTCPNCNNYHAQGYSNHKPFDLNTILCLECGLSIQPELTYLELKELNKERTNNGLKPLKQLPKQEAI